jgi:hypothetical protein
VPNHHRVAPVDVVVGPPRRVVRPLRRGPQDGPLLGLEHLDRRATRSPVLPPAGVLAAPPFGLGARLRQRPEPLAPEVVVAHVLDLPFDPRLVRRRPHPAGVHLEVPRLHVLHEPEVQRRRHRVRHVHHRLRIVGDHDREHPAEEPPGRLQTLEQVLLRLSQARPHELVPAVHRRAQQRVHRPRLTRLGVQEVAQRQEIHLELAGVAVHHPDRPPIDLRQLLGHEPLHGPQRDRRLRRVAPQQLHELRALATLLHPPLDQLR